MITFAEALSATLEAYHGRDPDDIRSPATCRVCYAIATAYADDPRHSERSEGPVE